MRRYNQRLHHEECGQILTFDKLEKEMALYTKHLDSVVKPQNDVIKQRDRRACPLHKNSTIRKFRIVELG